MALDLSLIDLITPYVLRGDSFGNWHAALAVLLVREHETTIDAAGLSVRGTVSFEGDVRPFVNLSSMTIGVNAANSENHPENDSARRDPWIDIRDSNIQFQLTVPRTASQKVAAAVGLPAPNPPINANVLNVLTAFDNIPGDPPPSDYPATEFVLDFILTSIVLRPPFLRGAKREADGQLVADPQKEQVKFTLPKIKMRLSQGSAVNDPLQATLVSFGASGLDDPGDIAVAELITMDPPYAFIGPSDCVGFGFRSGVLDLSNGSTPPDVLAQFGFDESWQGLYLPEIRLFVAPNGAKDFAVDAGVENLLIGFGQSSGITGDFGLTVLDQGAGPLKLNARFYDLDGRQYGGTPKDGKVAVQLPSKTRMVVDIEGGRTPFTSSVKFDGGAAQNGREFDVDLSAQATRTIDITVSDTSSPVKNAQLTVTASRRPAQLPPAPGTTPDPQPPAAEIQTTSMTRGGTPVNEPRLRIRSGTDTGSSVEVELAVNDPLVAAQTQWTVNGAPRGASASVLIDLPPGANASVQAQLPGVPGVTNFTAYYRFDHPEPGTDTATKNYATDSKNTRTEPAPDEGATSVWSAGTDSFSALRPILQALRNGTKIKILGYASFEGAGHDTESDVTYNTDLALRRAKGLRAIIDKLEQEPSLQGKNFDIEEPKADMSQWTNQGPSLEVRRHFWKAIASWPPANPPGTVTQGTVSRKAVEKPQVPPPIIVKDPPPPAPPQPPRWFRTLGAKVRIVRNTFVACEVFGKFDIQTSAEDRLQGNLQGQSLPQGRPLGSNPADGLIDIRLVVQIDDATDTVSVIGYYGADPADKDGLYMWGTLPGEPLGNPGFPLNFFGTTVVFMPLLSATAGAVANDGALAELAMTGAMLTVPAAIAALGWVKVERLIWYGGEFAVRVRPTGPEVSILFDIETGISLDVKIGNLRLLEIDRDAPLMVRYKAVGIRIGDEPGQPAFQFRPIFDASKGYSIDVSRPGAIHVADPLGKILQVLGARIARNNPFVFEIDLGFAIDLGVVTIERARVRFQFDPTTPPQLTAFGASVDIPAALKGRGYLEMNEKEIKGSLDLTIVPVSVRIAAGVGVAQIPPDKTGVIVALEVEFPVAIPLGCSGLGIYGFLGLFAMNYTRDMSGIDASNTAPALAWLKKTGGEPTKIEFWTPQIDTWAFGIGAILGTMGTSILFNMKGVILLELPGPRLLLMMKAKLLAVLPKLKSNVEGTFLCVIDLDMGRGTLTIGLAVDFDIDPLLKIKIPVEAFFNFNDTKDWHLYLGRYTDQIQAKILEVFEGSGYLMLSGNGLPAPGDPAIGDPPLPALTGFAIATGLHVAFIWGSKTARLYAELAAGFDAVIGFEPFRVAGNLYVRGTLHLFIIDISAWAKLSVDVGEKVAGNQVVKVSRIKGEICGKVEFLFFEVSGCVDFELGESAVPVPKPADLVQSVKLISRTPALVMGSGVDKPIDAGLADASANAADANAADAKRVPIDAIPLIMMTYPPVAPAAVTFEGQAMNGTPEGPPGGFVKRGDAAFRYTLTKVDLIGPLTAGKTPATWWKRKSGEKALQAQLALLSWLPEATPKAVENSKFLEETVKETWGTICIPVAPPTPVLWTFLEEPIGPSATGWMLDGEAWPDPPNTSRLEPPNLTLQVVERWRCGDFAIDSIVGVVPAQVEGLAVMCPPERPNPRPTNPPVGPAFNPVRAIRGLKRPDPVSKEILTHAEVIRRVGSGLTVSRSELITATSVTPAATTGEKNCASRLLAAPMFAQRDPQPFGDPSRKDLIRKGWAARKFKPGPFDDAVVFRTGSFEYATFYLLVTRQLLENPRLVVATCAADETVLATRPITPSDVIPPATLPATWIDQNGPWLDEAFRLVQHQLAFKEQGYLGVVVTVKKVPGCDHIQIGLPPQDPKFHQGLGRRPFYVAAAEVMRTAEVIRFDYETSESGKKKGVIQGVLDGDTDDHALLVPNTLYEVRVEYDAERDPATSPAVTAGAQSFFFKTDADPPKRLDPWMLCSIPEEGEKHFFTEEDISIVFGTSNVVRVFDAYNKRLQVRVKASSFRPSIPKPGFKHPFVITDKVSDPVKPALQPVKAQVLSPWETALETVLADSCIPISGERTRHSKTTVPIPLELYTDYVMDIEMVDKNAPEGASGPYVWRCSFSTGGFATIAEFARSFSIARIKHRSSKNGALQAIGPKFAAKAPEGDQLDAELTAAGLEQLPTPDVPRILVFWDSAGPVPQPAAILVDSPEPMWRSRRVPKEVVDPNPAANKRYEMVPASWLTLESGGGDPVVDRIIAAPGGQRALITLKPNSRGKKLKLQLRKKAQKETFLDGPGASDQTFTVAEVRFVSAPWEETD